MKAGWQTKKLGEIAEIELGKTPARGNAALWDEKKESANVWLSIADLLNTEGNVVLDSKEYISEKGAALCKPVKKDTLLVSFKLTLGRLAYAGRDLYTNEAIAALTLVNERELKKEFLFWFLQFYDWRKAAEGDVKIKGMTLNKVKLKEIPIRFPGLVEQQRIVGILDEAFAGIATAKANAEKNLQNARLLFESHLQSVFLTRGTDWMEKKLDELTEPSSPITYGVVKPGNEGEIRFVRGGDLVGGMVRVSALRTIARTTSDQYRRTLLRGGELLICLVGQPGQVAVAPSELAGANIARQVGLIRLKSCMNAEFVRYFLQSPPGKEALCARESGSVQQVINLGELRHVPVPHPMIDEQNEIVAKLVNFESETRCLESIYQRKLAALDALKQSLLHQAFSGQL